MFWTSTFQWQCFTQKKIGGNFSEFHSSLQKMRYPVSRRNHSHKFFKNVFTKKWQESISSAFSFKVCKKMLHPYNWGIALNYRKHKEFPNLIGGVSEPSQTSTMEFLTESRYLFPQKHHLRCLTEFWILLLL